jgi:hypothetical protein
MKVSTEALPILKVVELLKASIEKEYECQIEWMDSFLHFTFYSYNDDFLSLRLHGNRKYTLDARPLIKTRYLEQIGAAFTRAHKCMASLGAEPVKEDEHDEQEED